MSRSVTPALRLSRKVRQAVAESAVPLNAARAAVGATVLVRPPLLAATLGVDAATAERTAWLASFFGVRDLAVGVGAVVGSRGCQVAACASDISDLFAVVQALRAKQIRRVPGLVVAASAGGAAVAGAAALWVTRG